MSAENGRLQDNHRDSLFSFLGRCRAKGPAEEMDRSSERRNELSPGTPLAGVMLIHFRNRSCVTG